MADGVYGAFYEFNEPEDANHDVITVKKATPGDFGQACSPSIGAGWNAATMGSKTAQWGTADSPTACFNVAIAISADSGDIDIDGVVGSGSQRGTYGFTMPLETTSNTDCHTDPHNLWIGAHGGHSASNVTIQHVELDGSCAAIPADANWNSSCQAVPEPARQAAVRQELQPVELRALEPGAPRALQVVVRGSAASPPAVRRARTPARESVAVTPRVPRVPLTRAGARAVPRAEARTRARPSLSSWAVRR